VVSMTTLTAPPSSWRLVGTSDVSGDGKADILWQISDGTAEVWEMNGTSIAAAVAVGNPGAAWVLNNNDPPLPSAVQPGTADAAAVLGPITTGAGAVLTGAGAAPNLGGFAGTLASNVLWAGPAPDVSSGSASPLTGTAVDAAPSPLVASGTIVANTMHLGSG
jgi:hypothetical protein